ncbi:polyamine-modulated factor 1-binding protein 1-like [Hydractinia symbiolongicarpus]|uniref:polyamine-modulated factor 1-binding protein 1-like n=1 Tax=Hydractinia symbiolongicarpus TaxID=13093 RepID=UPI0025509D39|nr:polyamine-modulated factor 1-binding protein 1-like [Hydractinia symbiolongicarpus]
MASTVINISEDPESLYGTVSSSSSRLTSTDDLSKEELVRKLKEYRKANIELLEDKRHLLLRSQEACKLKEQTLEEKGEVFQEIKSNSSTRENMDEGKSRCNCEAATTLTEVIKVNHVWQKDYTRLSQEFNKVKARLWKAESQLRLTRQENEELIRNIQKVEEQQPDARMAFSTENNTYTLDDIEALKQQLIIYKEDYTAEKEDKKKLTEEQNKLKLELQKAYGIIDSLTVKNNTMKENYRRVSSEKEHIIKELRRLSTSTLPFSPVSPLTARHSSSQESIDTLRSEDFIAHSQSRPQSPPGHYVPPRHYSPPRPCSPPRTYSPPNIHIPLSFYGRGNVVRDGEFPLNQEHKQQVDLDKKNENGFSL